MTLFDEEVAAHYEDWYRSPEGQRADELEKASLRQLLDEVSRLESGLEVGCGTAHFTRWLNGEGLRVVGLDLSGPMLAQAQELNRIPLVQGDAGRLPFADGAVDVVSWITTLEFLEQPREALGEGLRVAQRGLVLGVLNHWSVLALRRWIEGLFSPSIYDPAHFYGVGELRRLLRSVTSEGARVTWHTTLFPRWWPGRERSKVPWGGFIGMALILPQD